MPNTRISEKDHQLLRDLAEKTGKPHTDIIHEALEGYRRKAIIDGINAGYARLRENQALWEVELAERELWDSTTSDGIEE